MSDIYRIKPFTWHKSTAIDGITIWSAHADGPIESIFKVYAYLDRTTVTWSCDFVDLQPEEYRVRETPIESIDAGKIACWNHWCKILSPALERIE